VRHIMMTPEEIQALAETLAQKALTTSNLVSGGLLTTEQSDRFITYMFDLTTLTKLRLVRMNRNKLEIEKIGIGTRLLRKATEYTTVTDSSNFTLGKVTLTTTKMVLPWDISRDTYKQNVERSGIEDTVQRLMALQAGNDFEDLCINGDATTPSSDPLLSTFDGWAMLANKSSETHEVMFSGSGLTKAVFSKMLKALPTKYQSRRAELRFYAPVNLVQDYVDTLSDRETQLGDALIAEGARALAFGVPVVSVPLMSATLAGSYPGATGNHGEVWLTFPENFITGVLEDIVVYHWFNPRKDTHEFTLFLEGTCQWENLDCLVRAIDVKSRN
jgi:hypothetical protein